MMFAYCRKGRRGRNFEDDDGETMGAPSRPSTANTLFDFLGDKFAGDKKPNNHGTVIKSAQLTLN